GGLQEHAVAADERGDRHAGRDREREVPRSDDGADAARLVGVDVALAGWLEQRRAGAEPQRLASVVLAEVDRLADVRVGFRDRLAGFEDLERRELAAPSSHERRGAEEDGGPLAPRRRTPGGERARRDVDC